MLFKKNKKFYKHLVLILTIWMFTFSVLIGLFIEPIQVSAGSSTEVKGIISINTTWTFEDSPYIIKESILVDKNTTLTIQPGAIIKFNFKSLIRVEGTLIAKGTKNKMITFTINEQTNSEEEWTSIELLNNPNNSSIIEWCKIEYAVDGIILHNKYPHILPIFQNNIVEQSDGINIFYFYYDDYVKSIITDQIINNSFRSIRGNAIDLYPNLRNNIENISTNNYTLLIKNNKIENADNGIVFNNKGVNTKILENVIISSIKGIYLNTDSLSKIKNVVTIMNNLISFNEYGFKISNNDVKVSPWDEEIILKNNSISNNNYGILLSPGNIRDIKDNNINNNSKFNVYINSPKKYGDFDFRYNWWGTTDTSIIDEKIYDYNNDWDLGKVNYIPFLTKPNPNTLELKVNQPPVADAGPDQNATVGKIVYFECNGSYDPEGAYLIYTWVFGDGIITNWQNDCNTSHIYNQSGNYTVILIVNDGELSATDILIISVSGNGNTTQSEDNDTDGDGMPDSWEEGHGFDKNDPMDANNDSDNDDLTNFEEFKNNTDPYYNDTDLDGLSDGDEIKIYKTSPIHADTDGDDYYDSTDAFPNDKAASVDSDGDKYPDHWNPGMSKKDSTTGLQLDDSPNDPDRHEKSIVDHKPSVDIYIIIIGIIIIVVILIIVKFTLTRIKKEK